MTRKVLITGGNSGLGYEMALALAGRGDEVVIAARSEEKSRAAIQRIKAAHPAAKVTSMALDLADFADVDRFAAALLKHMPVIDVLMLNAGVYTPKLHRLANGYESMIGVMHFGHFRLVQRLLEAVKAAAQGRIVVTSSIMHAMGCINEASFTDPTTQRSKKLLRGGPGSRHRSAGLAYCQAKLANLLFARELARRLAGTRVTVNAFHPGAVATDIYRQYPGPINRLITSVMITPAKGADTAIWLATAPELGNASGGYYAKRRLKKGSKASRDPALAERLWTLSERAMA